MTGRRSRITAVRFTVAMLLLSSTMGALRSSMVSAAESVNLGDTFVYGTCWGGISTKAALEKKYPSPPYWRPVAIAKGVKSPDCGKGFLLYRYKWTPRTAGRHTLRENISPTRLNTRTISKSFVLVVSGPGESTVPPIMTTTTQSTTAPATTLAGGGIVIGGTKLTSCYFQGKQLWGRVYFASTPIEADFRIYYTAATYQAELWVWKSPTSLQASSCGKWYTTNSKLDADLIVYVSPSQTNLPNELRVKVMTYEYQVGLP